MKDFFENHLFEGVDPKDYEHLEAFIRVQEVDKETLLMDEGQLGDSLFLLGKGSVRISRRSPEGRDILLTMRHAHDFFGEMALIDEAPRSAKVVTTTPCRIGLISKDDFNAMWHRQPRIALNIFKTISARLRQSNDQTVQDFLEREKIQTRQLERLRALLDFSKLVVLREHDDKLFSLVSELVPAHLSCRDVKLFMRDEVTGRYATRVVRNGTETLWMLDKETSEWISQNRDTPGEDEQVSRRLADLFPDTVGRRIRIENLAYERDSLGFLLITRDESDSWGEQEDAFVQTLASYMAVVLRNIQLARRVIEDEKMSSIGRASSAFLHDCKNLIAIVHLYAQMATKTTNPREIQDMVAEILRSAKLIMAMSREVLFFAHGEVKLHPEQIPVRSPIETALSLAKDDLEKRRVTIELDIPDGLEQSFDSDKMVRVFYNLILNACQAMESDVGVIRISAHRESSHLTVTVADNGPGIPDDIRERLFMPFATTRKDGTGLGLAIVKSIVEAHDGIVTVMNKPQGGAKFELTFPS